MQILADSRLLTGGSIFDKKFLRLAVDNDRIPPHMVHVFHERMAAFTAWEQEVLLEGRHPVLGFHGELMSRSRSGKRMLVNACVFGWQGLGVRMAREGVLLCRHALLCPCHACLLACLLVCACLPKVISRLAWRPSVSITTTRPSTCVTRAMHSLQRQEQTQR